MSGVRERERGRVGGGRQAGRKEGEENQVSVQGVGRASSELEGGWH